PPSASRPAATPAPRTKRLASRPATAARARPKPKPKKQTCLPGTLRRLGSDRLAYAAIVRGKQARAYRLPGHRPFATFGHVNVNGYPTVFAVAGKVLGRNCRARWVRAELPMRPNGTFGYLRLH